MFVRFPPDRTRLSERWAAEAFSTERWRVLGPVGRGESGVLEVENTNGLRAYAKPAHRSESNTPRAAHEKIAADLACRLGFPVAASLLWRDGPDPVKLYSLSASMFYQEMQWNLAEAKGLIYNEIRLSVAPACSAATVFHSWIGDVDRKAEHVLINLHAPAAEMGVNFIDHAFAMSHAWNSDQPQPWQLSSAYLTGVPADQGAIDIMLGKVASCPDATIKDICSRVPTEFLSDDRRDLIVANLINRKQELGVHFGVARGATG